MQSLIDSLENELKELMDKHKELSQAISKEFEKSRDYEYSKMLSNLDSRELNIFNYELMLEEKLKILRRIK